MSQAAAHNYDTDGEEQGFGGSIETIIPRIDIEAFCETAAMATALQDSAYDRRMIRTSVAVSMGGIGKASAMYQETATPHLLVIETKQTGLAIFDELEALAQVCDPDTKVIVCGPSNDVTLYRELKRQGVDEYIVSPAAPMQIIEAISTVFSDPEEAPTARTIGFVSVKGGAGASTLSHNCAAMLASGEEKEVILVDLDMQFGTAGLDFNREPARSVVDALGSIDELDDVKLQRLLVEHDDFLSILAAPSSLEVSSEFDESAVVEMIEIVRKSADFVVFDIPHIWTPWVRSAILQMDEIVLVSTPDLASLRNLKAMYDLLVQRRPNDAAPRIIINQVGMPKRPEIAEKDIVEIVGAEIEMVIGYDAALFGDASNHGQMLRDVNARHETVAQLSDLNLVLANRAGALRGKRGGSGSGAAKVKEFLSGLRGKLSKKQTASD
jgi:pilus assembly protein CpaE